jgi:outer membrane protein OmpA-like peptidoglycan-associated protein
MTRLHSLAAVAALALAACSTVPDRNVMLDDARRVVQQAMSSSDANRYAASELARARDALARADRAWSEKHGDAEVNHLAYLATQHGQLTLNLASQRASEARIATAGAERERLQADVRTRQAQQAQQSAQIAQAQAESAKAQAQFAQTQAQNAQAAAAAQAERADRLQRELQALAAKPTDHGMVLVLQDVLFDTGQATLKPGAYAKLDQIAAVLRNYPERRVMVEGFTDSVGSDDTNLALSVARAGAVRSALVSRGVGPDRVEARGHGEARPVASNDTQAGRQQNRRVEVVFSDERGRFAAIN